LDLTTHTSLSPIRRGFVPSFVNYKKGALDSQLQVIKFTCCLPSRGDSEFQVRGGVLKKIATNGGRRENFGGISCEKSRFYAKNHIFSNFRGARAGCAPLDPPLSRVGGSLRVLRLPAPLKLFVKI
jgi:hypothetical protein